MGDCESIVIIGTERFSNYTGYSGQKVLTTHASVRLLTDVLLLRRHV